MLIDRDKGDLISRAEAIARATHEGAYGYISAQELAELPSAEHKGKWININPDDDDPEQFGIYVWKCSVCGELFCCKGNYCMHCGAHMEGEEE